MVGQAVAQIGFDFFSRLPIVVEPKEVQVSSDAGILPIRQFDDQIGFTDRFIACLDDVRDPELIDHHFHEMVRQRIFGILAGYEDCNDHDALRGDPVFKKKWSAAESRRTKTWPVSPRSRDSKTPSTFHRCVGCMTS